MNLTSMVVGTAASSRRRALLTGIYGDTVLALSPIAYWRLGEPSGTTAVDEMGASNGTYVNTPTLGTAGLLVGDADTATTFTAASSEYMIATNQSIFNIAHASVSAIIQITAYPPSDTDIVACADGYNVVTTDKSLRIQPDGRVKFYTFDGSQDFAISASAIPLNEPVHLVGTIDGNGYSRIYVNGVDVGSTATVAAQTSFTNASVLIGGKTSTMAHFTGTVDEVVIWNRGITPSEVLDLYNASI